MIGGGIVGTNAGDLISEVMLAIEMGADAADIGLTIHPHPTLSETVAMAAEAFDGTLTDLYVPKRGAAKKSLADAQRPVPAAAQPHASDPDPHPALVRPARGRDGRSNCACACATPAPCPMR